MLSDVVRGCQMLSEVAGYRKLQKQPATSDNLR